MQDKIEKQDNDRAKIDTKNSRTMQDKIEKQDNAETMQDMLSRPNNCKTQKQDNCIGDIAGN